METQAMVTALGPNAPYDGEAARAVVGWGFERYALNKVGAYAALNNRRSWRVMEKLGMTREAVLRSNAKLWDEYLDDVYYGVLRREWAPTAPVCRGRARVECPC